MSADDDMRDRHGLPPRPAMDMRQRPLNLLPIRDVAAHYRTGLLGPIEFAEFAADGIPALCDEIVRLRAAVADQQVTPA